MDPNANPTGEDNEKLIKRLFGDHMAKEDQVKHVPQIIRIMYLIITAYSLLACFVTGEKWYTQIIFYFVILNLFYFWHWLAHQSYMGKMHLIHNEHHFKIFPPSKFYAEEKDLATLFGHKDPTFLHLLDPRFSTNFTLYHEGLLYVFLTAAILIAKLVFDVYWGTIGFFMFMAMTMGLIGSALHSSFHIKGFALEKYQWYQELRMFHFVHHLGNTQHNYSIVNSFIDAFYFSYRTTDPVKHVKKDT